MRRESPSLRLRVRYGGVPPLRPQPIMACHSIPLRRRLEEALILGDEVRFDRVRVDLEAQAWPLGHRDVAALDDRPGNAGDRNKVVPVWDLGKMVLQRDEVLGRGSAMDAGHRADR